jgi:hypothetical protein
MAKSHDRTYAEAFVDKVTIDLTDIKVSLAKIEEHLNNLNGKVAKNVNDIECNRLALEQVNLRLAKWSGAIVVILGITQLIINKFL